MMEAVQAILLRKSTRSYKDKPISEEALNTILEAGMSAPVGSGAYDSLHLTVVQNQKLFSEINAAVNDMIFKMLGKHMDKSFGTRNDFCILQARYAARFGVRQCRLCAGEYGDCRNEYGNRQYHLGRCSGRSTKCGII